MIPPLINIGMTSPWPVLPPGIHDATIDEVRARFATTPHRKHLFEGLLRAISALEAAGCGMLYLDGSFVSDKSHPSDFDGCWDITGVDPHKLDPTLLDFKGKREAQKKKYFGELFFAQVRGVGGFDFLSYFQIEKFSGAPKGILRIKLSPKKKGVSP